MIIDVELKYLRNLLGVNKEKEEIIHALDFLGAPVDEILEDSIRIEVNPNRPDLLSTEGISRALKGVFGIELGIPNYRIENSDIKNRNEIKSSKRNHIAFSAVLGVSLSETAIKSIMQFQEKLHISIGRNRRKYSIGLYDLDKIALPVTYKEMPLEDIEFVPLGEKSPMTGREILEKTEKGVKYSHLSEGGLVLMDAEGRIISMPPIINADFCKVTERTKNIFIDSTGFDDGVNDVVAIVASNLAEIGEKILRIHPGPDFSIKEVPFSKEYVEKLLGLENLAVGELLMKMRLSYSKEKASALVPYYRVDIKTPQDIAEEIAIAYGFYNIHPTIPSKSTFGRLMDETHQERVIKTLLVGAGFQEVMTFILTSPEILSVSNIPFKEVSNPVSKDYSALRPLIIPGLVHFLKRNKSARYPQKIFEIGIVVDSNGNESRHLAAVIAAQRSVFTEAVSTLRTLLNLLGVKFNFKDSNAPSLFLEGRFASSDIGFVGELNPDIVKEIGIPVAAFEIDLDKLLKERRVRVP